MASQGRSPAALGGDEPAGDGVGGEDEAVARLAFAAELAHACPQVARVRVVWVAADEGGRVAEGGGVFEGEGDGEAAVAHDEEAAVAHGQRAPGEPAAVVVAVRRVLEGEAEEGGEGPRARLGFAVPGEAVPGDALAPLLARGREPVGQRLPGEGAQVRGGGGEGFGEGVGPLAREGGFAGPVGDGGARHARVLVRVGVRLVGVGAEGAEGVLVLLGAVAGLGRPEFGDGAGPQSHLRPPPLSAGPRRRASRCRGTARGRPCPRCRRSPASPP